MDSVIQYTRYAVFAVFMIAVAAAVASWLVRTRRVSPFSAMGRSMKNASDVLVRPVERRVVRRGGNPVHAGMWLVVVVAIAGLMLIFLLQWTTGFFQQAYAAFTGGFTPLYRFLVTLAYTVLMIALFARVIGTWFGVFQYSRWMRPAYVLTDWMVKPIRRFLPPVGSLDVSPIAAWLGLLILRSLLLSFVA